MEEGAKIKHFLPLSLWLAYCIHYVVCILFKKKKKENWIIVKWLLLVQICKWYVLQLNRNHHSFSFSLVLLILLPPFYRRDIKSIEEVCAKISERITFSTETKTGKYIYMKEYNGPLLLIGSRKKNDFIRWFGAEIFAVGKSTEKSKWNTLLGTIEKP